MNVNIMFTLAKDILFYFLELKGMANECNCKNCKFCVQMRYLLNFCCYKFCMERISEWLKDFLVPLDSYLEHETAKCESFFVI